MTSGVKPITHINGVPIETFPPHVLASVLTSQGEQSTSTEPPRVCRQQNCQTVNPPTQYFCPKCGLNLVHDFRPKGSK